MKVGLNLLVSAAEMEFIRQQAAALEISKTEYVRRLLAREMESVLSRNADGAPKSGPRWTPAPFMPLSRRKA